MGSSRRQQTFSAQNYAPRATGPAKLACTNAGECNQTSRSSGKSTCRTITSDGPARKTGLELRPANNPQALVHGANLSTAAAEMRCVPARESKSSGRTPRPEFAADLD